MTKVLVLSASDDCFGPMAAAFLRDYSNKMEVASQGVAPADCVKSIAVEAMKECLIDLADYKPQSLTATIADYDFVVKILLSSELDIVNIQGAFEFQIPPAAKSFDEFRDQRDLLKNEMFIFYRDVIRNGKR